MHLPSDATSRRSSARFIVGALATVIGSSCSVQVLNRQPAQQLARESLPSGDLRLGWRVFQQKCAGCHGSDGTGTAKGPDLLPRVREMGAHRFAGLVLRRYDWILTAAEGDAEAALDDALTEKVVRGRDGEIAMPAWDGNPAVVAHIEDLYAYLAARADGSLRPGRP